MHWSSSTTLLLLNALTAIAADDSVFSKASNDSLLWGPYRPNLYFGLRPRLPKSVTTGLLWGRVEDFTEVQHLIRYTCEQNEDMAGYGWDKYDPRSGGVQTVKDKGNGIDMETSFVKFDEGRSGWGARVKGTVRKDAQPSLGSQDDVQEDLKTAVFITVGMEGLGSMQVLEAEAGKDLGFEKEVVLDGQAQGLGEFRITISESKGSFNHLKHPEHGHPSYRSKPLDHTLVHTVQVPEEALWQSKALVFSSIKTTIDGYVEEYTQEKMPPPWQTYTIQNMPGIGNFHMIQKVFEGPFEFDIFYTPGSTDNTPSSEDLTSEIEKVTKSFASKYAEVLAPQAPFKDEAHLEFSQSLFSNLIGGIGYFYGDQVVDRSYATEYEEENEGFWQEAEEARARIQPKLEGPHELFTSIPSRPFFPRGFLWDEGFHLLPIVDFDPELVWQILSSWFNTIDEDGWIAREQILGNEARSKVPQQFQTQYPHYANPPTLFMVLEALLDSAVPKARGGIADQQVLGISGLANPNSMKSWLAELYPLLQRNFDWYRKTQFGDLKSYDRSAFSSKEAYRWRGRTPQHILTSGLDDYPRAQPPHPGELHVDLMAWMGMMSRSIKRVAEYLGETEDAERYAKILEAIRRNTDDLHWSKEEQTYCDATIDAYEESVHVCHKGYMSIFPFMTGLMGPNHEHLGAVLDLIANKEDLWSPFGIRSLSKKDEFYGTEENYWRSPVWININYLIVSNLLNIAQQSGPHQAKATNMYTSLRKNLVTTVYESWKETGFAWEQFNPETGKGQRTRHFTGWTSLVVKIMSMPELKKGSGHDEL
ncbi:Processing alpha glucosidase I [Vermiconidia calcicola]|uniref:Processing alpha glucosidase I n=1 Tax=Vermiconidia calcicola TaxID=1690605 RepID=A0ACC3M8D3_9PEZI|nr:Processing alpha glucosidase I [Vermiconidia calcicola]